MGFECRIFISAEQFAMSSSIFPSSGGNPASLSSSRPSEASLLPKGYASTTSALTASQGSSSGGVAAKHNSLAQSRDTSPSDPSHRDVQLCSARSLTRSQDSLSGAAAGGHVVFASEDDIWEFEEDVDFLAQSDEEREEILPVRIPANLNISPQLTDAIWVINDIIHMLNDAIRGKTKLDPSKLARAFRDRIRLNDPTNDHEKTVLIFLTRLLSSVQRIGSDDFDINHSSNIVALIASGFIEPEAVAIIDFLAGRTLKPLNPEARCLSSCDRAWYFVLFITLKLQTDLLDTEDGVNWFFGYATNHANIPNGCPQAEFSSMVGQIFRRFGSIRAKGLAKKSDRKKARNDSANSDDAASQAGSEFSSATQTPQSSPLWKHYVAFVTLSKLSNEWMEGNELLCQGKAGLNEEALLKLIFRFLKRMQCSKTGTFDTDRKYSTHIYEALMRAYWTEANAGKKLILRLHDTFSALLCATCNYAAAIEWLAKAIKCFHPKDNKLTADELALINFALSASAMGVQSLATCSDQNMQALFLYFFNGNKLKVIGKDSSMIESAIDRVAQDFLTCPFGDLKSCAHSCVEVHAEEAKQIGSDQVESSIPTFRGRGDQHRGRGTPPRGRGGQHRGRGGH